MFFNFRFLKIALAAIFFCSLLLSEVSLAKPKDEKSFHELEEIRAEISLLNLLRGLYLSKDQAKKVIEIANRAQAFRDETKQLLERDYENVKEDFTGLRDSLFQPVGKEKPFQNKASVLNDRIKEAREVTQEKIAGLEDEARLVLSSAQLEIIDGFKPCLVPPKDLSNPVRVGQASAEGGKLEKLVELIHSTPETVWKERGDSLLAKVANHIEAESGEMTPDMKSDIKARLSKTAGKIRQASDVDFVLKKNTLKSEMLLINPKKTLSHEHRKSGKIAQWLLSPTAFSVLPKWLESLDKQTPPDSTIEETPSNPSDESALAEKTLKKLTRLFRQRKKMNSEMPSEKEFINPIEEAVAKNDRNLFFNRVISAVDLLMSVKPDKELAMFLGQAARQISKSTGFPILNPKLDPYGYAAELEKILNNQNDPEKSCKQLRDLISIIRQFKGS